MQDWTTGLELWVPKDSFNCKKRNCSYSWKWWEINDRDTVNLCGKKKKQSKDKASLEAIWMKSLPFYTIYIYIYIYSVCVYTYIHTTEFN